MKRFLFVVFIVILQISQIHSQSVSFKEAEQVAKNFFGKTHKSLQTCASVSTEGSDTLLYVFNADNGFVVISGDKKTLPVLAYSTEGVYDADNVIPPVKMWLDSYRDQLKEIRRNETGAQNISVHASWEKWQQPSKSHKNTKPSVEPLLTSKWDQGKQYNYYCPQDKDGVNGRAITGCVATAMAQLMYYFRFPEKGSGSYTYTHDVYGEISADFESAVYDYSSMTDKPTNINPAISLLMSHCGVAVDMQYGPASSGMRNHKAAYALKTNFNFSPQTQYVFRDSTDLNWDSLIVSHLDNKIPLYYAGWKVPDIDGHGFICDGYQVDSDDNYYYHFNFGWSGSSDGYFYTDTLSPGGYNFNLAQELIIHAYPDTTRFDYPAQLPLTGTTVLTAEIGSFTDGTIYDCPSNMNHTWIIRPDRDNIQKIQISIQYKLAENDTVFITSLNNKINQILTNDTSSFSADVSDTEVVVRLKTTNEQESSGGFSANYTTVYPAYCSSGLTSYTTNKGTIDDGSGNYKYNNFTECKWRIAVNGSSITLTFSKFDTEQDKDILYIAYPGQTGKTDTLELSGQLGASVYTFNTNVLLLTFKTDEKNVYQGWTLSYDTDVPQNSISDGFPKDNKVSVYPNPANDNLFIEVDPVISNGKIQLFDICGKLLKEQSVEEKLTQINLSDLTSGIYYVRIKDNQHTIVSKKIVRN